MNQKLEQLFYDRSPQKDQCFISLLGEFCEMFLSVFGREGWNYIEEYEYEGISHLEVHGVMRGDFGDWDSWIQDNNINCVMTQEFMDQDFDYYISETFVNGEFTGDSIEVLCHSQDEESLQLLKECMDT